MYTPRICGISSECSRDTNFVTISLHGTYDSTKIVSEFRFAVRNHLQFDDVMPCITYIPIYIYTYVLMYYVTDLHQDMLKRQ